MTNPASNKTPDQAARKRIPMSVPRRKLEVPDIEGFHLHWFLDANVPRAMQAGYEMVKSDEVPINQFGIGNDTALSGNADLGSNVRVVAGLGESGQPQYLNLMKIKLEWWKEDQQVIEKRNADVMAAIFQNEQILGSERDAAEDRNTRYVKTALLNRPTRKGR